MEEILPDKEELEQKYNRRLYTILYENQFVLSVIAESVDDAKHVAESMNVKYDEVVLHPVHAQGTNKECNPYTTDFGKPRTCVKKAKENKLPRKLINGW